MRRKTRGRSNSPESGIAVLLALALDFLGEPPAAWHPVVWYGKLIQKLEQFTPRQPLSQFLYGIGMLVLALSVGWLPASAIHWLARRIHPGTRQREVRFLLSILLEGMALKPFFALRMLAEAGQKVRECLEQDDLAAARQELQALVSRDRSQLTAELVSAAAIESLAENLSDSVVAPLFYYLLFGLPGAATYRLLNTFDSMIWYHGRYEYLGKAAARKERSSSMIFVMPSIWCGGLEVVLSHSLDYSNCSGGAEMGKLTGKMEQPVHGAFDYAELELLGLHPEEVIDFSVNSNPYGPSPRVREAIANVALDRYPDRMCLELRRAILDYEMDGTELTLASLICGNGTAELIWTIARACLRSGMRAAIIGPTFGEYHTACLSVGATVSEYRAHASAQFQPDIEEIVAWIREKRPSVVWLCNPNNPTGTWIGREEMLLLAKACQENAAMLVVDEAYWHFVTPQEKFSALELIGTLPGLEIVVLRSLTKDFALAGLRLGYAVAAEETTRRLNAHLPSWNVNSVAQAAGVAALTDRVYLETTLQALMTERTAFFQALVHGGLQWVSSRTHFCLLVVENAHDVRQQLLTRKMLVRDCTSFGLPHCIRISTRSAVEWQGLLTVLQEMNV